MSGDSDLSGGGLENNIDALVKDDTIGSVVVLELDSTSFSSVG